MTPSFWQGKKVFLTGHTGFKGGWLALWLHKMGAKVTGMALPPSTTPSFFTDVKLQDCLAGHHLGDIRDLRLVQNLMEKAKPDIVMHLAAQPLVRYSYEEPVETYATNVMGTVHVLEAARACKVPATLVVSSDKCYANMERAEAYSENDKLGGHDPYSSSKACTEIVTEAYARSFFIPAHTGTIGSARAGNVIGGGDWTVDRLVPDLVRALAKGESPRLRNPGSIRPWQHVLDPLYGYLMLVESIFNKPQVEPVCYNFGPDEKGHITVGELANMFCDAWGGGIVPHIAPEKNAVHEAKILKLDTTKAKKQLGWKPLWDTGHAAHESANWYKAQVAGKDMRRFTLDQIELYCDLMD